MYVHMCVYASVQNKMTEMTDYDERRAYVAASQRPRARESERERESTLVGVVCVGFLGEEKKSARLTVSWLSSCASSHAKYVYMYV